jgi:hypothetical protein
MPTIAILALAASVYLPAGTYRYTQSVFGRVTDQTTITVKRRGADITIDEVMVGSLRGVAFSSTATLTLRANFTPARYDGVYRQRGGTSRVSVEVGADTAKVGGSAKGTQARSLTLAPRTRHFAVIEPGLLAGLFALPAELNACRESAVTIVVPTMAGAERITTTQTGMLARPDDVPKQDRVLTVGGPVPFSIWYDSVTFVVDKIVDPSRHAVTTRLRDLAERPRPVTGPTGGDETPAATRGRTGR